MPHVRDVASIARLLRLVESSTRPSRVTAKHLVANGFDAPDAKSLLRFLKAIRLLDDSGATTDRWRDYRDADDRPGLLAGWVRESYAALFEAVPDVAGAGNGDLEALVVADLECNAAVARQIVRTLRALCVEAGLTPGEAPERPRRERRAVIEDVSRLMQRSVAEFEAARSCLAIDLVRPAVVSAWNSYAAMALAHLSADDFAIVRGPSPQRATMTISELAVRTPGRVLVELLAREKLIDADHEHELVTMLRLRNDCALPTTVVPTRAEVVDYLSSILTRSGDLADKTLG